MNGPQLAVLSPMRSSAGVPASGHTFLAEVNSQNFWLNSSLRHNPLPGKSPNTLTHGRPTRTYASNLPVIGTISRFAVAWVLSVQLQNEPPLKKSEAVWVPQPALAITGRELFMSCSVPRMPAAAMIASTRKAAETVRTAPGRNSAEIWLHQIVPLRRMYSVAVVATSKPSVA